jgi:hypothetical protein
VSLAVLVLTLAGSARAGSAVRCLVVSVNGAATVEAGARREPLEPFRVLTRGDAVALGDGAAVVTVCEGSAARSRWTGAARLQVGATGVSAESGRPPETSSITERERDELQEVAALVTSASADVDAQGPVRQAAPHEAPLGVEEQSELAGARTRYTTRLASADPRDIGPEMRLAASLIALEQYGEACKLLKTAELKCRGCRTARSVRTYAERRAPGCGSATAKENR